MRNIIGMSLSIRLCVPYTEKIQEISNIVTECSSNANTLLVYLPKQICDNNSPLLDAIFDMTCTYMFLFTYSPIFYEPMMF